MRLAILIGGLALSTVVLLFSVLYQSYWGLMFSIVFQVLPVLATRDELGARWWYTPGFLARWGATLLGGWWLQVSEGLQVSPIFNSFGPGYLIMAVIALIWPKWFNSWRTRSAKE